MLEIQNLGANEVLNGGVVETAWVASPRSPIGDGGSGQGGNGSDGELHVDSECFFTMIHKAVMDEMFLWFG